MLFFAGIQGFENYATSERLAEISERTPAHFSEHLCAQFDFWLDKRFLDQENLRVLAKILFRSHRNAVFFII